ncbi:MBL fold metallo-hydrolase [Bacillus aquiflavi]|uniref:MBL fold metallo-hydrolase n=1 Tax=Bacillus aquiflavi TaxID=2672567 RepID=A0A6B3W2M2_9BACI|nr:MBL fold metallo-hydrolase [Bacillus aquiflavi]MBA4538624.1 MBL fold metallo-hydrolase [Bacillus aquiflavi]NEY82985.1 MBL fold metallo-hydrolase [Bacillus aquiflavi]UAC49844.1 MBL fold metallo-hydrolase [Bacillus aquiflavi]
MNVEKIDVNGYRIGIPVPFPMKYVYCYLFEHVDGYVLIDAGFNDRNAKAAWKQFFQQCNIHAKKIKTIYLTHFHPDHAGLAGWMQQLTGADVYMHEIDLNMINQVWGEDSLQTKLVEEMNLNHGVPRQLSADISIHMDLIAHHVHPLPQIKPLMTEEVEFGGKTWEVIHTPGHSNGHICFYQKEKGLLISGDHILDKITPNISLWPGASNTPLHDYIQSLRKIKELHVEKAFPGHGDIINRVNERIEQLIHHHKVRLKEMEELAHHQTAYQVADHIFAKKKLSPHQWRFAIAETIAHLEYLSFENKLKKENTNPIRYEKINLPS